MSYLAVTMLVALRSPILDVDRIGQDLHLRRSHSAVYTLLADFVVIGQRGPATLVMLPWFLVRSWRLRSWRPVSLLGLALLTLNLVVGATKLVTGRIGPLQTSSPYRLFSGGDIYPSGHVANCVVLYGMVAMLVAAPFRRFWIWATCLISVSVGVAGVLLNMHWPTDVVGGWLAGGLVLCVIPALEARGARTALGRRLLRSDGDARPAS